MIPFDFIYLRPDTLAEATQAHRAFARDGQAALYYGGGSEIISMCRVGAIKPDAVIDVKRVPELNALALGGDGLTMGAALTLSRIASSKRFALMTLICGRIADHTNQCRITLGGNLCGTIIYRETCLPLLLSDASVTIAGPDGVRDAPFADVFDGRMRLEPGELVVCARVPSWALSARHAHIKKTAQEKIDYPLVDVAALWRGEALRVAFSGLADHPFRSPEAEAVLNDRSVSCEARAEHAIRLLEAKAHADAAGSKEYRLFVARNTLKKLLEDWEDGAI